MLCRITLKKHITNAHHAEAKFGRLAFSKEIFVVIVLGLFYMDSLKWRLLLDK